MICFQRDAYQLVPGCLGGEGDSSRVDYCVPDLSRMTPPTPSPLPPVSNPSGDKPITWSTNFPLAECEGTFFETSFGVTGWHGLNAKFVSSFQVIAIIMKIVRMDYFAGSAQVVKRFQAVQVQIRLQWITVYQRKKLRPRSSSCSGITTFGRNLISKPFGA